MKFQKITSLSEYVDNNNVWVAEHSHSQQSFNVQLFKKAIQNNFIRVIKKEENDWVVIGYGTRQEVSDIIESARFYLTTGKSDDQTT